MTTEEKMNKTIVLMLIVTFCLVFTTACWVYGKGESVGYITTVEDTGPLFKTKALWFRAELESSQTDCYVLSPELEQQARIFQEQKQKVKIIYNKHFNKVYGFTCSGTDQVVEIKPIINQGGN